MLICCGINEHSLVQMQQAAEMLKAEGCSDPASCDPVPAFTQASGWLLQEAGFALLLLPYLVNTSTTTTSTSTTTTEARWRETGCSYDLVI